MTLVKEVSKVPRVSPAEALELMRQGYTYVDVRSEREFVEGHPAGAFNIPLMHAGLDRLEDNPEFMDVVRGVFSRQERLLIGCRSGVRSLTAAGLLEADGYVHLAELREGFKGTRDDFGRLVPGWMQQGLPTEAGSPEGRSYAELRARSLSGRVGPGS
jgi:rhodanese-related sulfurtransferase